MCARKKFKDKIILKIRKTINKSGRNKATNLAFLPKLMKLAGAILRPKTSIFRYSAKAISPLFPFSPPFVVFEVGVF